MRAIILYVEQTEYKSDFASLIREATNLQVPKSARRLAPNVWLLNLPEGGDFRRELAALAKRRGLLLHSLEVAHEGQWLRES
jgi:hypothetical protein